LCPFSSSNKNYGKRKEKKREDFGAGMTMRPALILSDDQELNLTSRAQKRSLQITEHAGGIVN
jgi:hypothetical protein